MKTRNLLILSVIVLSLAAYLFFFERHRPTTEEAQREADSVLHDFDRDHVVGLTVETDSGRVHLVKSDDHWHLDEPIEFPADEASVSSTLSSLDNLQADRRLSLAEVNLADYGLDSPAATVTLTMDDGAELALQVGDELPLGSKRTVRLNDGDELMVVPGWFMTDVERELTDWRSRDVVDLSVDQVASIDIEAGEDTIRAVRLDDHWQLMSPLEDLADRDHLQGLVSDLNALRIEEFLDGDIDPGKLGLVHPEYRLTVIRSDGEPPVRLDFGDTREGDGGPEVACRRGDGEYFWVADRVRTRLSKAPVLWRSKKVWPLDTWQARKLVLDDGQSSVELEKVDFKWQLVGGGEVEQSRVTDRLTALADLEATDYDLLTPPTPEIGHVEITLAGEDDGADGQNVSFTFFEPLSKGGQAVVRVSERKTLMGVDPSEVDRILGDLTDLTPPAGEPDAAAE